MQDLTFKFIAMIALFAKSLDPNVLLMRKQNKKEIIS